MKKHFIFVRRSRGRISVDGDANILTLWLNMYGTARRQMFYVLWAVTKCTELSSSERIAVKRNYLLWHAGVAGNASRKTNQTLFHMTLTMVYHTYTYYFTDHSPSSNASKLTQLIQHVSRTGSVPFFRLASKTCYYISTFIPLFSRVHAARFRKFAGSPQVSK